MKALEGIVVIDLTRILSGPYCSMALADMGAEVIKVEPPKGDDTRQWGPPFINTESAYFLSVNRNKKSIVINLKEEKGKEILFEMIKKADVVIENFRPGTIDRLGVGYETLKEINPRIILASISGFGQTGPYSRKPGYDVIAQGMGGLIGVTGEPGERPVKAGYSLADIGTGMWAAYGILAAIIARGKTGEGQWIDASLLDTMISWQTYMAGNFFASGKNPKPQGGAHPNIVPYQLFESSDGYFNIAVGNDSLWVKLCNLLDEPQLRDKYPTNPDRVENREYIVEYLQNIFRKRSTKEWITLLEAEGIPAGPVLEFSEIFEDEHVLAREQLLEVEHTTAGKVKMTGMPIKLSQTQGKVYSPPPLLGENTKEILSSFLSLSEEEISKLEKSGVVMSYSSLEESNVK